MNILIAIAIFSLVFYLIKKGGGTQKVNAQKVNSRSNVEPNPKERDAWGGNFWETSNQVDVRAVFRIDYTDAENQRTIREIEVSKIGDIGTDKMIMAHCRLRNSTRTFLLSRIHKCTDVETGEIVSEIGKYLENIYVQSPVYFANKLLNDYPEFLKSLLYVAKADGALRKKEKELFISACNQLANTSLIDEHVFEKMISTITVPSLSSFRILIGKIAKQEDDIRKLFQKTAIEIVATQKDMSPTEKEALEYIEKRFQE